MNLASKHKLIFYTAKPFQNAQNNFSTHKTHQVIDKRNFRTQKYTKCIVDAAAREYNPTWLSFLKTEVVGRKEQV
jgi:hypothetical protein